MHITTIDVMSVNGKIAKEGGDTHSWTSDDDWDHFKSLANQHNLLVMDLETYQAVQPEPEAERLRIIVTDQPETQTGVPGQLEFINQTPAELVKNLEARGYERMLLVGKQINAAFLYVGLVQEMVVTVEPVIFGGGEGLLDMSGLDLDLKLHSVEQLNEQGTVLLWYSVDKKKSAQ